MGCTPSAPSSGAGGGRADSATPHRFQTRIFQDEEVDNCKEAVEPVGRIIQLQEGDFVDGRLGLLDKSTLLSRLADLDKDELYEDPDFSPTGDSLRYTDPDNPDLRDVVWLRPHELCRYPQIFVDGANRGDVRQGELGDCWFLSVCSSIAREPSLVEKVIHPEQPLYGHGYKGVVKVKLWRFGEWVSVYMDDRLPTRDGQLLYASCPDPNEFWVAFVEKAFAKIHGCYEALEGGQPLEAFVDLTGGLAEIIKLEDLSFSKLQTAYAHGAFIACSRDMDSCDQRGDTWTQVEEATGLVQGHSYTVTEVVRLEPKDGRVLRFLRIRNPWADQEWKGAWNDGDPRWDSLDNKSKETLHVINRDDGEFWMVYEDFRKQFKQITIATLGPDFYSDGISDSEQKVKQTLGKWVTGENAGGCRNNLEKFATNPQYLINLTHSDDPDSEDENGKQCSLLVGLMQEHRRSEKKREMRMRSIAFFIYKTDTPHERLSAEYFLMAQEAWSSAPFINCREVIGRFLLDPGYYVIIPATYEPDQTRTYLIRIFGLKQFEVSKLPDQEMLLYEQDAFIEDLT